MRRYLVFLMALVSMTLAAKRIEKIDLSGEWDFGYGETKVYDDVINLPGSMLTNGKGREVDADTKWTGSLYDLSYYHRDDMATYRQKGNIKFPFFLTPDKEYVGNAFYRRYVDVPEDWKGRRVELLLERPHIETCLYVNGDSVGHDMSLSTPHLYDVTKYLQYGKRNEIELKVYNGIENVCVGQDSHSVTDQTQGNWNGVVGEILLRSKPSDTYIKKVRIFPDVAKKRAIVKVIYGSSVGVGKIDNATATALDADGGEVFAAEVKRSVGDTIEFAINMGERMKTWDEFSPSLYRLEVKIGSDSVSTTFGMRDIKVSGRNIEINGRPVYMRGTVENCCFPLTGYPPTDTESWDRIFSKCKEYGINMMRFHSYCPPDAAFEAADKAGIYLQPEGPSWPNHGVKLKAGMSIDGYLIEESKRIIDSYGHHPSFVMMAAGNEPAGDWVEYCKEWVGEMKAYDPTKIYCGASVGGGWAWDYGSEYHVKGGGRGLVWSKRMPSSDDDYSSDMELPRNFKPTPAHPVNTEPILAHEQGQWCVFPDFREISQYTGPYKARNFEIFKDLLNAGGMGEMAGKFLNASGRLQALCYKYEIERNLRTPGYSGFQLLGLNDYSGQGTALEGVLNVFWNEKGYISSSEWRQFCSQVVPLARFPRFVFSSCDTISVPIEIMNAGPSPIDSVLVRYRIKGDDGSVLAHGVFDAGEVPIGKNFSVGAINAGFGMVAVPTRYSLNVSIPGKGANSWEFWVYPEENADVCPDNIYMADSLDSRALEILGQGGSVLIEAAGKVSLGSDIVQHYLPVFWNTSWFKMRPPHTTGAYIDKSHPLFGHGFPTDDWGNLNWWELLNRAQVMNLLELPASYQSPVQPIDTWHVSRKLGMILEANVLNGKLFMTTIDISSDLDKRIVARRMRNAIISYMSSEDFNPTISISPDVVNNFFTKTTPPIKMYTNESPDELKPKLK